MSNEIKPGDLVMVVRGMKCCGFIGKLTLGSVHKIVEIANSWCQCAKCYTVHEVDACCVGDTGLAMFNYMVKKLPPPALSDESETNKELEIA